MINVDANTFNTTIPKSRKQVKRKSAWSTVASVLQPQMITRLRQGFKPTTTPVVNQETPGSDNQEKKINN